MLNQTNFKNDIKDAYLETRNPNRTDTESLDWFANKLAEVFIKHIKTLTIEYSTGLTAPNGPVTGTLNHTVS